MDSVVSDGAQDQQKINLTYAFFKGKNLSDLENEAADFPRFIVIESLEEIYLSKFSLFLIENDLFKSYF